MEQYKPNQEVDKNITEQIKDKSSKIYPEMNYPAASGRGFPPSATVSYIKTVLIGQSLCDQFPFPDSLYTV